MSKPFSFKRALVHMLLLLMVLLAGCNGATPPVETEAATLLPKPKSIPDFELSGGADKLFNNASLKGRWSLFFFGYTRCPDVCPTELFMMAEMMRKIENAPETMEQKPQVVFVSVDPQQDKPDAVRQYAGYYHPTFTGVTGEQAVVDQLSKSMGAIYERVYYLDGKELLINPDEGVPEGLENAYLINHSATIFLTNPDGALHAVFSSPHLPEIIIKDLTVIQQGW